MKTSQRNLLLALVFALAAGLAAGAWWLIQSPPPAPPVARGSPPPAEAGTVPTPDEGPGRTNVQIDGVEDEPGAAESTVVFPLEIDLELVASAIAPSVDGISAMGSDATARIAGSVHGSGGEGLRAEVRFVAGANEGRVIQSGRDGAFGANDLYPGLSIVRIAAPGTQGSLREVLLRKDRETQLNLGYGRPALVQGEVKDSAGGPIQGARVTIDGQETETDEKGEFAFEGIAAGETLVIVEKPGYAAHLERLTVVGGLAIEKGRLAYVLRRAARLEITIEDRINVEGQALVYVLPEVMDAVRDFPWYRVNPVRVYPGGTAVVEDLPAKHVRLRLFHAGALANPRTRSVELKEGDTEHVSLHLEPAPVVNGVVTEDGRPVAGAEVVLEAPQRSMAMLSVLGQTNYLDLEREVLPDFPPAVQRVKANAAGEFVLSSCENVARERYLHARSPDGKSTGWKLLRGGETRVDLVLERAQGDAEIVVQMDGRVQPLPVKVKVDGAPRDLKMLPPGQDLHIPGLAPGTWRFSGK